MVSCRFGVGQGALAWFVMGWLLLASACSSDSNALFDDAPPSSSGGDTSSGGSKLGFGAADSGGSGAESGAGQGNGASGKGNAGTSAAGGSTGGASSAGSTAGGSSNAGTDAGGMAGAGSGGKGGTAGNGGSAGAGGSDECTAASFGQHSYYFCGLVDSALLAAAKCQSLGMSMVSIESQLENAFVLGKQKGSSWLGGTDELSEGHWIWATGIAFWDGGSPASGGKAIDGAYENFIALQPNDNGADGVHENCIVLTASGWNDLVCTLGGFRAACESSP